MKSLFSILFLIAALLIPDVQMLAHSVDPEAVLMTGYVMVSVGRPAKPNAGTGGNKKDKIIIFNWDEIQSGLQRDAKGVLIPGPVVFKAGKYGVTIYATPDTIVGTHTHEGERDNTGWVHQVAGTHPGDEVAFLEFVQNNVNKPLGVLIQKCDSSIKKVYGSPCAPLMLQVTGTDDNAVNNQAMTFVAAKSGYLPGIFEGNFPLESVLATLAAGATSVDLALGSGEYQTQGHSAVATIATLANAVHGQIFTLLGIASGSNPPTIAANTTFILRNGTAWNAIPGSKITFKVFQDGAATFKAIEVGRS